MKDDTRGSLYFNIYLFVSNLTPLFTGYWAKFTATGFVRVICMLFEVNIKGLQLLIQKLRL